MRSDAHTVEEYLAALPEARRRDVAAVRELVLAHLPPGYEEAMNWGMIAYQVPLAAYSDTYNGQPLLYAAIGAQKHHTSIYLMAIYADGELRRRFEDAYRASGKRLDVGKSCVRFRAIDDLPLDVVGTAIEALSADEFVRRARDARSSRK